MWSGRQAGSGGSIVTMGGASCWPHVTSTVRQPAAQPAADVGHAVTDQETRLQVKAVLGGSPEDHARPGLAALTGHAIFHERRLGMMGTRVNGVEAGTAAMLDPVEDDLVQGEHLAPGNEPPGDNRLIADHGEEHSGGLEFPQGRGYALEQADLLRANEKALIVDQDAIAIQKYGPTKGGHREGSAT